MCQVQTEIPSLEYVEKLKMQVEVHRLILIQKKLCKSFVFFMT